MEKSYSKVQISIRDNSEESLDNISVSDSEQSNVFNRLYPNSTLNS